MPLSLASVLHTILAQIFRASRAVLAAIRTQPQGHQPGDEQQPAFRLLDLPPEIRNNIYQHVLISTNPIKVQLGTVATRKPYSYKLRRVGTAGYCVYILEKIRLVIVHPYAKIEQWLYGEEKQPNRFPESMRPALPVVSRQLRSETRNLFIGGNTFDIDTNFLNMNRRQRKAAFTAFGVWYQASGARFPKVRILHYLCIWEGVYVSKYRVRHTYSLAATRAGLQLTLLESKNHACVDPRTLPVTSREEDQEVAGLHACPCEAKRVCEDFNMWQATSAEDIERFFERDVGKGYFSHGGRVYERPMGFNFKGTRYGICNACRGMVFYGHCKDIRMR